MYFQGGFPLRVDGDTGETVYCSASPYFLALYLLTVVGCMVSLSIVNDANGLTQVWH